MDKAGYLEMDLLRFTTAGSVDDGKSTLIGRLLYDSKSIFDDQYEAIKDSSEKRGEEYVNLALLTDGLRAEREQGITIDVAYRYFATPKRKFIISDTPGHIQYTRNMVTGASTSNLAIILIDARKGVIEQTRRHSYIASLLRIPNLVVCVNKMDLVEFKEETYNSIVNDFKENVIPHLDAELVTFIPISALKGDNVVDASENMNWYKGETLLQHLENVDVIETPEKIVNRFPVQYVVRPISSEFHDYRGYAGRVAGGVFKRGDEISVFPSGLRSKIKSVDQYNIVTEEAFSGMSVTITLEDELDISRGDMITSVENAPLVSQDLSATICWLSEEPLQPNGKYALKHTSKEVRCVIKNVLSKIDINSLQENFSDKHVAVNDIARVEIKTTRPLAFDAYKTNRISGSFILIDEASNNTVAAGMIL
ncbi:MAG: GTP-binding protein [Bacteroidia bacterium]|nr:GTP-binding protein [Bacteroidia bacterium]